MSKNLKLENQICFPFYAISRKITKMYYPLLKELDLTYPQYLIMLLLWEKDGLLIKNICDKLFLETNTISPILENLVLKGIVKKEKKSGNNKEIFIFLTDKGLNLKEKALNIPAKLVNKFDFDLNYLQNLHKNLWALLDKIK